MTSLELLNALMTQNLSLHSHRRENVRTQSIKITDLLLCTSANVIYCITYTYCKKLYIDAETGGRLAHQFQEDLCHIERNDKDASKPVARHFNLPNHSKHYVTVCSLSWRKIYLPNQHS